MAAAPTQIERPFRVSTSLGADTLLLDSFVGVERVSDPFRFLLRVLSPDPNVDMQSLLNGPVVLSLALSSDQDRNIHGNINRVKLLEFGSDGMAAYEIEMVPWFWFLNLFSDCHIFQNLSVPDIVEQVFQNRGFSDYESRLTGTYNPRVYCVQYRETDFNFVSRLLEEEGIFYFFEHTPDKHTLVLADDPSAFAACPNQSTAAFMAAGGATQDNDIVFSMESECRVQTGTATLNDYDFTKPTFSLLSTLASSQPGESYDYPGKYSTSNDGDRYAKIRLEELEVGNATVRGESNCMNFQSGFTFTLSGYYASSANMEYTLLSVEHHGRNTSYQSNKAVDPYEYRNRFEAIPNSVPFHPARRARKPVIEGTQTALVVGKSGEEIWTDKYGRVTLQFHWDRIGVSDEKSSCWIRVAQGWAGNQWGFICIPRIGQEVVVSFLEGDPDQPLITGSVYNSNQMPPYTLPDKQTQSTWKSMSSKGGGGFNELRFEDNKGSEQIFIHGQKDMDMKILNDRREWIGEDRHLVIVRDKLEKTGRDSHLDLTRDHIEKIGRDHHLTISGKEAISITGSHSLAVTGDVIEQFSGNHSSQVTQNLYLKAMQVVIEADVGLTLSVGGNFITIDASGVAIFGTLVQINSGGSALSGSAGSLVSPLSPTAATNASDTGPGAASTVTPGTAATPVSMTLTDISPASAPAAAPPQAAGAAPPPAPATVYSAPPEAQSPASNAPAHDPNSPDNQDKTHFVAIQLSGEDGSPITGEPYRIVHPDGTVSEGTTDDKGSAKVTNLDPGSSQVTFPNRDQDAWG